MEKENSIAKLILNEGISQKGNIVKQKASAAPYSQPLQRLLHKEDADNHYEAVRIEKQEDGELDSITQGCIVLSSVTLSKKKKGKENKENPNSKNQEIPARSNPIPLEPKVSAPIGPIPSVTTIDNVITPTTRIDPKDQSIKEPEAENQVDALQRKTKKAKMEGSSDFSAWLRNNTSPSVATLKPASEKIEQKDGPAVVTVTALAKPKKEKTSKIKKADSGKAAKATTLKKKKKKKSQVKSNIERSIQEKEEVFSEALADLYAEQGHYKKAIKMYKKLSLINPEKSSFFAPLIEKLKKKLK